MASFGVGVGIGVDFFRCVFAWCLMNGIPSPAELREHLSSFWWPNAIPISFSTPTPIPTPILADFLCLSLFANILDSFSSFSLVDHSYGNVFCYRPPFCHMDSAPLAVS